MTSPRKEKSWQDAPHTIQLFQAAPTPAHPHGLSPRMTVSQLFERFAVPVWFEGRGKSLSTIEEYRVTIAYWKQFTQDPPLDECDDFTIARFMQGLRALKKRDGEPLAPKTIDKHCRQLQTIFLLAGPRGNRGSNADRLGQALLDTLPWIQREAAESDDDAREELELDELERLFDAAGEMTLPRRLPVTPGLWWTSLLIGVYNLGERRGAIFRVRFCDVLFDDRRRFPAGYVRFRRATRKKGLRLLKVPLNDSAKLAIEAMRRGREEEIIARPETLIWGLPIKFSRFHKLCRDLLSRAGAPKRKRNGLHRLRKSMANAMAGISLLATQRMLGHADFRTTKESYIGDSQTSEAVTRLPQPPRVADMLSRTPKPDPRRNMVDRKFPPAPGQVEIPLAE